MKTRTEITRAFRAKYEALRSSFRVIGPFESNRISRIGDVLVCDLGQNGRAAFVMHENGNVVEVHGGIYEFWKQKGGANGEFGLPVSDEADYHGPDARSGDRISEFENGIAVWRADTWQTEARDKSEARAPFDIIVKFRAKYDLLKQVFPKIGAPIEPGIYRTPNGGWQCNYANNAAITIRPGDSEAHEVYGGICERWCQEGGAFDETGKPGWLGFPISGVEAFHDLGDSNNLISHFENGDIVLIAQNTETRIVNSRISKQEFMETIQKLHEKTIQKLHERVIGIISDQLDVDKHQISRTTSLCDDLGADWLDLSEINNAFEEEFGVEIPSSGYCWDGYCWDIRETVGEIEQYLIEHLHPSVAWQMEMCEKGEGHASPSVGTDVSSPCQERGEDMTSNVSSGKESSCIWRDEFEGTAIDESKWSFEIGTGNNGWGNNEKEYYTARPENAYVKDGILHIRVNKESYQGAGYTSARMVTKGKFSFTYGTVEARIALPVGKGIWPAFWMLGENIDAETWPACGEIDVAEAINSEHVVYGTTHWRFKGHHAQYGNSTKDFHGAHKKIDVTEFHIYRVEWNEKRIAMYVDDFKYNEISIENNVGGTGAFHKPFFLLLNVAVGGNWPGFEIDDSQFPNEMLVDYIRITGLQPEEKQLTGSNAQVPDVGPSIDYSSDECVFANMTRDGV